MKSEDVLVSVPAHPPIQFVFLYLRFLVSYTLLFLLYLSFKFILFNFYCLSLDTLLMLFGLCFASSWVPRPRKKQDVGENSSWKIIGRKKESQEQRKKVPADGQTQVSLLLSGVGVLKRNNAIKWNVTYEFQCSIVHWLLEERIEMLHNTKITTPANLCSWLLNLPLLLLGLSQWSYLGCQTSDSASSSKFQHLALLVALVSNISNFYHWPLLPLLVELVMH